MLQHLGQARAVPQKELWYLALSWGSSCAQSPPGHSPHQPVGDGPGSLLQAGKDHGHPVGFPDFPAQMDSMSSSRSEGETSSSLKMFCCTCTRMGDCGMPLSALAFLIKSDFWHSQSPAAWRKGAAFPLLVTFE